jgi:general secretion pathway protein G
MTMPRAPQRAVRRRGFTLVEVLLVLVILVVIASLAVTAYGPIQRRANINAAKVQIGAFETPLETYRLDVGDFPSTDEGLEALREMPSGGDETKWSGPYLGKPVPPDPWGQPYQYEYPGTHDELKPDVWSMGPDMIEGSDDDVGNWIEE